MNLRERFPGYWAAMAAFTFLAAQAALGQGGQGGGGFGGGGFGGVANPESGGDRFTGKSILTPGQYGEWPITAREGETIIVHVTSSVFDPAVEVVDSANKVVAQNDDIRVGEQDSQLLYTFSKPGKYRVLVKGFKGGGGGQYEFDMRRFIAADAALSKRMAGTMDAARTKWYRFRAEKGKTAIVIAREATYRPNISLFSPIGEERYSDTTEGDRSRRAVYQVETAGDQYVRIGAQGGDRGDSFAMTIAFARELNGSIGQEAQPEKLEAGGMDVWKLQGKAGDLVRLRAISDSGAISATAAFQEPDTKQPELTPGEERIEPLVLVDSNRKSPGELVVLLNRTGTMRVNVSQPLGLPASYTFSTSQAGRTWKEGESVDAILPLGESDYWFVPARAGSILQLGASSSAFDTAMTMLDPRGQMVGLNDDGGGKTDSLLTQLISRTGRHIMRISGGGGSGPYKLRWLPNPVRPLPIGAPASGTLGAGAAGIWSFTGRKDQTVIVSARSTDFDTVVRVFGPDGLEIANADDGGDGTDSLAAIRLPLDGTYTLWVTGKSGAGGYSVRVIDADK